MAFVLAFAADNRFGVLRTTRGRAASIVSQSDSVASRPVVASILQSVTHFELYRALSPAN